jgi:hypothetical protein
MRKTKSCGCVIATNLIEAEKARRKHTIEHLDLKAKAAKATSTAQREALAKQAAEKRSQASRAAKRKRAMHARFAQYIAENS